LQVIFGGKFSILRLIDLFGFAKLLNLLLTAISSLLVLVYFFLKSISLLIMKIFTQILRLLFIVLMGISVSPARGQSILDPSDAVITYNPASPPASPAWGTIGKWVRTVRLAWNTSNYKCYIYNGLAFRVRFPKSYNPAANDGKKYPMLVFFNGAGEDGPVTDNEYQLFHGGQLFDDAVADGTFDGYIFCMQSNGGGWGEPAYQYIRDIMNYMVANNKLDPFRITVNGLSAGGAGAWDFAINYTNYAAGNIPMSAASLAYLNNAPANLKYIPTWLIQGGLDGSPDPSTTIQLVNAMNNVGCNLKYQVFPNDGHDTWDDTWSQPDFWPFVNRVYASNPYPLFGRSQFCPGDPINITVGVTQGFQAYQWRMNGTLINGAGSNTIKVTQLGTYDCRVERNGLWSDWSHIPLVVSIKTATVPPAITIPALTSNVIPALDTSHGAALQVPAGYASYLWQAVGGNTTLSTTNTLVAAPGQYRVKVTEQFGCSSSFSAPYTVVNANGANKPSPVTALTVSPVSQTALQLDWTVSPGQQYPQTGFEVYQASQPGGPYKIIALPGPGAVSDTATGLNPGGKYYYVVRAVNGNAAAAASNEASGMTSSDVQSPMAPTNLSVTGTTHTSVSLSWTAATDNVGVTSYDIYMNGLKVASTPVATSYTIYNLKAGATYNFTLTARDFAKNTSPFSNQVTAQALQMGYSYKYYTYQGSWSALQDLSGLTPVKTGYATSTDLSTRTQETNFAYLWEGYLHITQAGAYTFQTSSDDGSRLWLGGLNQTGSPYSFAGTPTVSNDGLHAPQSVNSTTLNLSVGVYPIAIGFYQEGGGYVMTASWSTPQTGAGNFVPIPVSALSDAAVQNGVAPAAPSGLVATALSSDKIGLSWTDNSNNETGFQVWRSSDSLGSTSTTIAIVKPNVTTYTDSGLAASTRYYYRVQAIGQYGQSAFDNAGPGVNYLYYETPGLSNLPDFNMLTPVSNGHVQAMDLSVPHREDDFELTFSSSIKITTGGVYTFFTTSDDGSALYIDGFDAAHRVVNNDFLQAPTERSGTVNLSPGLHLIYVTFFERGGGQDLEVRYEGPGGSGIAKQLIPSVVLGQPFASATTLVLPPAPAAPTALVAHGTSTASSVTVRWTDNATNEESYQVYRSSNNNNDYALLVSLPANAVSYADSGLSANGVYYYKVRAVNPGGNSAYSNEDSAHTADQVVAPLPNLRNVYVNFNDGSAAEPAQGAPWNNMNSAPNAGATIANLKDELATSTGFGLTMVDGWTGANNVGPVTGNNSGVYPDNVMQSLYYDGSGAPRHINITGLSSKGKYNVIFYSGRTGVDDNRITDYTIGDRTVSLNGASNTSKTVQINNISPDASGNISIAAFQDAGAPFTYINALQLQYSFDTSFYAPGNLVAVGTTISTIQLSWVNNTPGIATGFEVWRSNTPTGSFSLLGTVGGTTTTFTDGALSPGMSFFYQVRTVAGTRKSAFSNIAGGSTVAYTVEIQMNDGSQNPAQGVPWNSINTLIYPGYLLSNMINTQSQPTGMNLGMLTNFTGYNVVGTTTGNNSGIYPDNVMQGFYYVNFGDTARLFVSGLDLTSTYNFNFFGSRVTPPTSVISNYQIGRQVATLDATNNSTKTVQIAGVKPDSTGTIYIILYNSDGGRAYLNALTIDGVPSAYSTIGQPPVATRQLGNGGIRRALFLADSNATGLSNATRVSVFPNPFVGDVTLSLELPKAVSKLSVALLDVSGKVIHRQELGGIPAGSSVQSLNLGKDLAPGNYFILLQGLPDGGVRTLSLLKTTR
jgi:fibronectin type 3 domain-containing protein